VAAQLIAGDPATGIATSRREDGALLVVYAMADGQLAAPSGRTT
jgi:hypothetical protein